MLRQAALILTMCFGGFAEAQEAPPATPPPAPQPRPAPAAPGPGAPGEHGGADVGAAGTPTRVPELLARTPDVARVSSLIGAEILDESSQEVGRLDDFVARPDGRLVAIVVRSDGRIIGLPLAELVARAKPDLEGGSERATIRSFELARVSRHLLAAPEVEDKSHLDDAWLARLDAGTPGAPGAKPEPVPEAPEPDAVPATPPAADAPPAGDAPPPANAPPPADAPPPASPPLPLLSAQLGRTALDPAGQPIGSIVDFVVGIPKSRVAYVVVVLKPEGPDGPEAFHAVPFEALAQGGDEDGIRLTIGAPELLSSPRLDGLARLPVDPLAAAGSATQPPR